MNIEHLKENGTDIAVISSDEKLIVDTQSALDLAMTVKYETGVANIVISKSAVCEEFLSSAAAWRAKYFKSISIIMSELPFMEITRSIQANH